VKDREDLAGARRAALVARAAVRRSLARTFPSNSWRRESSGVRNIVIVSGNFISRRARSSAALNEFRRSSLRSRLAGGSAIKARVTTIAPRTTATD
jgi:hypothetical protein